MNYRFLVFSLSLTLALLVRADVRPNDYSVTTWFKSAAEPRYPLVHPDGRITFRVKAASAAHVDLSFGEWDVKPQAMMKNEQGHWTITIGPLVPEIYCYTFSIDGIRTLDLGNPEVKVGTEIYGSVVEVPGKSPRFDQIQDVPHGITEIVQYTSSSLHRQRGLYVYLPPEYRSEPGRRFPVLYLRHGGGDSEASWISDGKAGVILDNLLAAHEAVPMIIVMTNGLIDGTWASGSTLEGMAALQQELMDDVIPWVEKNYRVRTDAQNRAIAGLSMGGGQAFVMGLRNVDRFSWIGEFSAGLLSAADFNVDEYVPGLLSGTAAINQQVKILWLGCGDLDPRYNGYLNLADRLSQHGLKLEVHDAAGGHEWKVWRHQLRDFLKVIFQPDPGKM